MSTIQSGYSVTAPTALTAVAGTASGSMDVSAVYQYKVSFITIFGETTVGTNASASTNTTGSMSLSAIPVSTNANVSQRKIYRTAGGATTYLLLATINDNTTTTYLDTIADGSLGVAAPTINTAGSRQNVFGSLAAVNPNIVSLETGITAGAGGTSLAAYQLSKEANFIVTVTTANDSVKLPGLTANTVGMKCVVKNLHANTARIYPFDGQQIDAGGADVPVTIATTVTKSFIADTASNWRQMQ